MDYCTAPSYASGGFIADSRFSGAHRRQRLAAAVPRPQQRRRRLVERRLEPGLRRRATGRPRSRSRARRTRRCPRIPVSREKPFLYVDGAGSYDVFVPDASSTTRRARRGRTARRPGRSIPIDQLLRREARRQRADDQPARWRTARTCCFTPGVYDIDSTIARQARRHDRARSRAWRRSTAENGVVPDDASRTCRASTISGLIFDAGAVNSPALLRSVDNSARRSASDPGDPTALHDVFFRIGGPHVGKATVSLKVNSDNVILDDIWAWRADHGTGVGLDEQHRRHRRRRQRRRRHRDRPLRRALPEVRRGLERQRRPDDHVPERDAVRPAEPGRVAARAACSATPPTRSPTAVTTHEAWGLGSLLLLQRRSDDPREPTRSRCRSRRACSCTTSSTCRSTAPATIDHVVNDVGVDGDTAGHDARSTSCRTRSARSDWGPPVVEAGPSPRLAQWKECPSTR